MSWLSTYFNVDMHTWVGKEELTVTYTLFLNVQQNILPVTANYPFGIPCRMYDVEENYVNLDAVYTKKLPIALLSLSHWKK